MARVTFSARLLVSLLLLLSCSTSHAQDSAGDDDLFPPKNHHFDLVSRDYDPDDPKAHLRPSLGRCLENSGAIDPVVYQCFADEIAYQDKRLNVAYKKLMAALGGADKEALRTEERKWIGEMKLLCGWGSDQGSRGRTTSDNCDVVQRGLRATELERRQDAVSRGG